MSFVTKTFTTDCTGDLIDAINEDPDIGGQGALCLQIIDPQDGTSIFEFVRDLTAEEDTALDDLLASWVCPPAPPSDDGSTVINDDLPPSTETAWTSAKVDEELTIVDEANSASTYTVLSTTSTMESGENYMLESDDTYSLPDTTTVVNGDRVKVRKTVSAIPIINVAAGGNTTIATDLGETDEVIYDMTQGADFVFDGTNWTLEFGAFRTETLPS